MANSGSYSHALKSDAGPRLRLCKCGGNCGLSWEFISYKTSGARKYHPNCPVMAQRNLEKKRAKERRIYKERAKAKLSRIARAEKEQRNRSKYPHIPEHLSYTKFIKPTTRCQYCEGMPWRREQPVCRKCREPYQEEQWQTEPLKNRSPTTWLTSH